MGYACITDPTGELIHADFLTRMRTLFHEEPGGTFFVDNEAFRFRTDDFSGLERVFGPHRQAVVDRYEDASVAAALKARGLTCIKPGNVAADVAARLECGQIIAMFQGRQEVGPRALGHRSILTDPSRFDARNRLNLRVKYCESFRPFAPSVLPSGMASFFERPSEMLSTRDMLFALPLRELACECRDLWQRSE